MEAPFLLFDDARAGGPARLYRRLVGEVRADRLEEVLPALDALQAAVRAGKHAAGFLTYEAGYALDPALAGARQGDGPLLWFGLFDGFETVDAEAVLPEPASGWNGAPEPQWSRGEYVAAVDTVHEQLRAGDYYQVNLTFPNKVPFCGDPAALYARMRRASRMGWGALIRHPGGWLLSLSPEQFFTLRNGVIEARPMKGTAAPDAAAEVLTEDAKNRAENLMIVDLLRNDLARVAEPGSVAVPELFAIERYPTVTQMVSRVTARLQSGLDAVDVLRTIFPCGSVTGAPKVAAMKALRELEPHPRGAYCGSAGWIEPGGDAAFNVMIRTLEVAQNVHEATLGLGSGLVVDSDAADEWVECQSKGAFVTRDRPAIDLIETMRFDPGEGVIELDRHLDRLGASAEALQFRFNRHAARNELQAATFGRRTPATARLLLSPTGVMAVEVRAIPRARTEPARVKIVPLPVATDDYRLRFKTTDRAFYDEARINSGADEVIFADPDGRLTEGSFTSLFVKRDDGMLVTPPLARGLIPGILRDKLIAEGKAVEGDLRREDLAGGFLLGNMLRGLVEARLAD
ncbi:aminodeoxychorismate synthase component I [Sphingomonas glaciei]|uniref:Probable branched-chain-amino-acid aminotransferase n=1 Tax=Sphingomonas glaciei TaxID=2938948 RepID=A0ABY5MSV6_9SPHN|nr:aminodeoxychorismate synthase component I [Sphingomonas glaciei]UUR07019.1 aminodeoxychorismate synthase component I [Sphingomonas glaciei]